MKPAAPDPLESCADLAAPIPRVLVVGIATPLTWLVTRCLARAGLTPVVLGFHPVPPVALSRDCRRYVRLTGVRWIEGELDPAIIAQVERTCLDHRIDLVIAADHDAALLLAPPRSLRNARVCTMLPHESFTVLHDKWQFSRVLERLRLPYPATELARTPEALLSTALRFPIVTKPTAKWAGVGFQVHASRDALESAVKTGKLSATYPVLVQEFVPGRDVGFSFLAKGGRLLAFSMFDRQESEERRFFEDERLIDYCSSLLEDAKYSGVGHFDLRYDPAVDQFQFLELNPRFWASVLVAASAGVNYPALLTRIDELSPLEPVRAQRRGKVKLPAYEWLMSKSVFLWEHLMWRTYERILKWSGKRPW